MEIKDDILEAEEDEEAIKEENMEKLEEEDGNGENYFNFE